MTGFDISSLQQLLRGCDSRFDLWIRLLALHQVRSMAEIGVWKGEFSASILRNCRHLERFYMIDPWANLPDWNKPFNVAPEMFEAIYQEMCEGTAFAAEKRVILRGRSSDVLKCIPDESLDFAYIDGDHTLKGITIDLIKVLPKIKQGGIIGGDDFTTTAWQHDVRFEPTLVFPYSVYFAEAMDLPIVALPHNQFLIKKDAAASFSFTDTTGEYGDTSLKGLAVAEDKRRQP
ncbi:class I SAM-dependent methyltransferase [Bradyrhizobium diazoefficiens]|nr:class I SAM-dependent methyltransferase [Bradyrhizobium diazoefficiens]MBR0774556.1 class I SAM-dependent methyltransferase [Bradyrhizobium diazoefficiens]